MRRILAALLLAAIPFTALAWDAHGHRTITYLALDGLPGDMPAFLRDPNVRNRIADEANQPDRWRSSKHPVLAHENNQDHYLDIDLLDDFGLTLDTLPPLRNEYLRAMIISKHEHPDKVRPYDARKDTSRSSEWPGALPYAIMEHWTKLQIAFQEVRILEKLNDPKRAFQLETARNNVIYHMGLLSHFIGDGGQPLHTTMHHHGWVGDNPNGYTTESSFHSYIDGGCIDKHKLNFADVRPLMKYATKVDMQDPWRDALDYIRATHELVEPLYQMQKDGSLDAAAGKKFLAERLAASGEMLRAFYVAAWISSAPDLKAEQDFVRYNNLKADALPTEISPPPASAPSAGADAAPAVGAPSDKPQAKEKPAKK